MAPIIRIDGSEGEGGGQVLRTSLALAAMTGRACRISAIRANRPRPGLAAQHLAGVRGAALLCQGVVEGAIKGSREVLFKPGELAGGTFRLEVGTAGAISLVLQVLVPMVLAASAPTHVTVAGGTDVAWSPTIDYFDRVHLEWLRRHGARVRLRLDRRGFYPRGGGRVVMEAEPWSGTPPFALADRPRWRSLHLWSVATPDLRQARVAERQVEGFRRCWETGATRRVDPDEIAGVRVRQDTARITYEPAEGTGTTLLARLSGEGGMLGASALGRRGVRAERVGEEVAEELLAALAGGAAVDRWAADQLVPYLGLYGGVVRAGELSLHARTNMRIVERFLPVRFDVAGSSMTAIRP